jgi:hypothetical protein
MNEDASKSMDDFSDLYEQAKRNEKIMKEGREAVEFFKRKGLIEEPLKSNRGRPRKAN